MRISRRFWRDWNKGIEKIKTSAAGKLRWFFVLGSGENGGWKEVCFPVILWRCHYGTGYSCGDSSALTLPNRSHS